MKKSIAAAAEEPSVEEMYTFLKRDIANRLRNSCSGWAPSDFEDLVEKVTRTTMKYPRSRRDLSLNWSS